MRPGDQRDTDVDVARLAERLDGIHGRVERIDTELGETAHSVGKIQARCSAHDQMTVTETRRIIACDHWRAVVDGDLKSLNEVKTQMNSTAKTVMTILSFVGIMLMLAMNMWQTSLAHQAQLRATDATHLK
jgi:hypothetical protein